MPRRKYPEPDAKAIFNLEFRVHTFHRRSYNAQICIEFPITAKKTEYVTIDASAHTRCAALRAVIVKLENASWYHIMHKLGARFRVTGEGMDKVYQGYL